MQQELASGHVHTMSPGSAHAWRRRIRGRSARRLQRGADGTLRPELVDVGTAEQLASELGERSSVVADPATSDPLRLSPEAPSAATPRGCWVCGPTGTRPVTIGPSKGQIRSDSSSSTADQMLPLTSAAIANWIGLSVEQAAELLAELEDGGHINPSPYEWPSPQRPSSATGQRSAGYVGAAEGRLGVDQGASRRAAGRRTVPHRGDDGRVALPVGVGAPPSRAQRARVTPPPPAPSPGFSPFVRNPGFPGASAPPAHVLACIRLR